MSMYSRTRERNKEILERYNSGESVDTLAREYGLSAKTIICIVSRTKERAREIYRDMRLDDDAKTKKAMSKLRRIQIGDVLRIRHNSFEADGTKSSTLFMGTVVYKDNSLVTVRGDHFAESFQWFDLIETLVDHIRT